MKKSLFEACDSRLNKAFPHDNLTDENPFFICEIVYTYVLDLLYSHVNHRKLILFNGALILEQVKIPPPVSSF